jgi:predicted Zn-dependent peptidase
MTLDAFRLLRRRRSYSLVLTASLAAGAAGAGAQVAQVEDLTFPPLPAFDVPTPTRTVLDNGLVVLLLENHELPLVDAVALIRTGAQYETADQSGLAQVTGQVLRTGGTARRTGDQLDELLESKAASIETAIGRDSGTASLSALKEDFPAVLRLLAEVLREPAFAEDKISLAKNAVEAGIARQNDNPQGILFRELPEIIYGPASPYSFQPTYASLASLTRDDLAAWHRRYFHPDRIILGVVGDFESGPTLELIREVFGSWPRGPATQPPPVPYDRDPKPGVYHVQKSDINQSNIAMGHLGIRRDNPDYYAVEVMNQVLGGAFASRLFSRVRSDQGLAYAVFGSVGSDYDREGLTILFTTTKTETTGAAIEALLREARNMTTEPPTDDEVTKAKQAILSSFVFNFDSPSEILRQQLTYEYYGYPLDWLTRYQRGIEAVTTAQAREAAAKYLHPDQLSILVVGPKDGLDKPLSTFGPVTPVDITIPEPPAERAAVTAEGQERAAAVLDKAVEALGGAGLLASLQGIRIASQITQSTPQGEQTVDAAMTVVFPDRLRQDLTLPFGEMSMVMTPEEAFVISPQGVFDLPDSQRQSTRASLERTPLWLLKARSRPDFTATALGVEEVDGQPVEVVQVEVGGAVTDLGFEPAGGRLVLSRYQGPGPGGAPGTILQRYSDHRQTGGLTYPFKAQGTFNGELYLTIEVQTVEVNPQITDEAWQRPEG